MHRSVPGPRSRFVCNKTFSRKRRGRNAKNQGHAATRVRGPFSDLWLAALWSGHTLPRPDRTGAFAFIYDSPLSLAADKTASFIQGPRQNRLPLSPPGDTFACTSNLPRPAHSRSSIQALLPSYTSAFYRRQQPKNKPGQWQASRSSPHPLSPPRDKLALTEPSSPDAIPTAIILLSDFIDLIRPGTVVAVSGANASGSVPTHETGDRHQIQSTSHSAPLHGDHRGSARPPTCCRGTAMRESVMGTFFFMTL
jgi:hypothetical protein